MSDDIEVHFDPESGHLSLSCGEEAFARLRDLVLAAALIPEIVGPSCSGARRIEIESVPMVIARRREPWRWPASLGCGLAILVPLIVFIVGLWTILRWTMQQLAAT